MASIELIRVFISSPSQVAKEREIAVEICNQVNRDLGFRLGFRVEPITWQTHTSSARSSRPQAVINEQIPHFEVYCGIMGSHFGTNTGEFGSGTEEEFFRAIQANDSGQASEVQFYFSNIPQSPSEIDTTQLEQVRGFKEEVGRQGILYKEYSDLTQFEVNFRSGITTAALKIFGNPHVGEVGEPATSEPNNSQYAHLPNLDRAFSSDPLVSSSVLTVQATDEFFRFTDYLKGYNGQLREITNILGVATKKLEKLKKGTVSIPSSAINALLRAVEKIERFNAHMIKTTPDAEASFSLGMSYFQRAAKIVKSSELLDESEIDSSFRSLVDLRKSLSELEGIMRETSRFWGSVFKEGDRIIGAARTFEAITLDFADFLRRAIATTDQIIEEG